MPTASESVPAVRRARSKTAAEAKTRATRGSKSESATMKRGKAKTDVKPAAKATAKAKGKSGASRVPKPERRSRPNEEPKALMIEPDMNGPRIRLGVLWFLLAMAAGTSGRSWIAVLCSAVSGLAGYQVVSVWNDRAAMSTKERSNSRSSAAGARAVPSDSDVNLDKLIAATLASLIPLAAGYSTGATGAALLLAPAVVLAVSIVRKRNFRSSLPTMFGAVIPALAAAPIVLTVRADLWAGLFLIMAVSMYDAGSFLTGGGAASRWEGPAAGIIGVFAATFTMAVFHPSPFTPLSVVVSGAVIAIGCPLGQMVASKFLPKPTAAARGLRRLDAYLVTGPLFYICAVAISGAR